MMTSTSLTKHRRIRRSEETWRKLVGRFEQSGQMREQFCADQGLALSTFSRWRQRLRSGIQNKASSPTEAVFVELTPGEALASEAAVWDVELQLGTDVVLRLRRAAC
jgi:hypothetical protein